MLCFYLVERLSGRIKEMSWKRNLNNIEKLNGDLVNIVYKSRLKMFIKMKVQIEEVTLREEK